MHALLTALVLVAAPSPDAGTTTLRPSMQASLGAVIGLQPLIASPVAFRDPANAAQIRAALEVLSPLEHFFTNQAPATGVATLFARELNHAKDEFRNRNVEAARARLRSITALCFGCHVRQPSDRSFPADAALSDTLILTGLERASFFASTRQFDRAFTEWNKALAVTPKNDVEAFEQTEAIRLALSVAIQGEDNPQRAISLLEQHKDRKELPGFVTRQMKRWLIEAKSWQLEKFDSRKRPPAQLVSKAKALIELAGVEDFVTPDDTRLVSHLRAAGYLQEALRRQPTAAFRGEALYLLGVVSAANADPLLWRLEWITLESCIRENPKTDLARRCADRLSERTYFAYTSRGGLDVPGSVASELGELNALAK
ncbi:MAG: hypothetical protein Q8L14_03985 [Myxococcales bacterium]|nr:hypothetical protein [Myxococcales bacterium]